MASDGSKGPRPYTQRELRTLFVRVAAADWSYVKRGYRDRFVAPMGQPSALFKTETPTPAVLYSVRRGTYDARLMILTGVRQEILGAVNPVSLGFDSMPEFRRYWMQRERRKFPPTRQVFVYTVRPWTADDYTDMGVHLIRRLYGEFMEVN